MGAEKDNEYWKLRKDLKQTGKKLTPEEITDKAQEYIDYCLNNPLKSMDYRGNPPIPVYIEKTRAMSLEGLFTFLDICKQTWANWKKDEKYLDVITRIDNIIFRYNFEGASANILNANIIARKMGISEKTDVKFREQKYFPDAHQEEE